MEKRDKALILICYLYSCILQEVSACPGSTGVIQFPMHRSFHKSCSMGGKRVNMISPLPVSQIVGYKHQHYDQVVIHLYFPRMISSDICMLGKWTFTCATGVLVSLLPPLASPKICLKCTPNSWNSFGDTGGQQGEGTQRTL